MLKSRLGFLNDTNVISQDTLASEARNKTAKVLLDEVLGLRGRGQSDKATTWVFFKTANYPVVTAL